MCCKSSFTTTHVTWLSEFFTQVKSKRVSWLRSKRLSNLSTSILTNKDGWVDSVGEGEQEEGWGGEKVDRGDN